LIADPTRARLLYALNLVEELSVGDLALALDVNEDAVGYALQILRTAGLVTNRRTTEWCTTSPGRWELVRRLGRARAVGWC